MRVLFFSHALRKQQVAMQPLQSEAKSLLWFCRLQTQQLCLVVGRPTFAISPQAYTRNNLRRSKIQKFTWGGACPTDFSSRRATHALMVYWNPLFKILDPPLYTVYINYAENNLPWFGRQSLPWVNDHRHISLVVSQTHFLPQHSLEDGPGHGWWLVRLRVLLEASNKQLKCYA